MTRNDIENSMREACERAMSEGMAKGKAEGKADGKAEVARKMKALGVDCSTIAQGTGLTVEEVEAL